MNKEIICKDVNTSMREYIVTLEKGIQAMQEKIEEQLPVYQKMPLAQQVVVGTGSKILRQNPAVQEFRALMRDYSQALNTLQTIVDANKTVAPVTSLSDLRAKFKVAK